MIPQTNIELIAKMANEKDTIQLALILNMFAAETKGTCTIGEIRKWLDNPVGPYVAEV